MPNIIKNASINGFNKRIIISYGEGEWRWTNYKHGKTLLNFLKKSSIEYILKLYPFSNHVTISKTYPSIIKSYLEYFIGINDIKDTCIFGQLSPRTKFQFDIKNNYTKGSEILKTFNNKNAINFNINEQYHYGNDNIFISLNRYVYINSGWYINDLNEKPIRMLNKNMFWRLCPKNQSISFLYQDSLLQLCEYYKDKNILEWLSNNLYEFLSYIKGILNDYDYDRWHYATRRVHFMIAFHCLCHNLNYNNSYFNVLPDEIINDTLSFIEEEFTYNNYSAHLNRVLALFHVLIYFRKDINFYNNFSDIIYNSFLKILDFYFDNNGCCIIGQSDVHNEICKILDKIHLFISSNNINNDKYLYKYNKIFECLGHITSPDGVLNAIGHSWYSKNSFASNKHIHGSYIIPSSNICYLEDDKSIIYITINGGSNIHSQFKHCDLLSFTLWYDGIRLFRDSEGGLGNLQDYAHHPLSHTVFTCDFDPYYVPEYDDFTAFNHADNFNEYFICSMSNYLIDDVVLKRIFIWIKPNIIIIYDIGYSDDKHTFIQNYMLSHNTNMIKNDIYDDKNKFYRIKFSNNHINFQITQYNNINNIIFKEYFGTNNINDIENYRGSYISAGKEIKKAYNISYEIISDYVDLLTSIELHSDNFANSNYELYIQDLYFRDNYLLIKLNNDNQYNINISQYIFD